MEVLTTAEMERADQLTIAAGTPGFALMLSAGQAVAEAAMDLVEEGPVVVVAGRGNHGGARGVATPRLPALCARGFLKRACRAGSFPVRRAPPSPACVHPTLSYLI